MSSRTMLLRLTLAASALLVVTACDSARREPGPELLDEVDLTPAVTVEVDGAGFDPDAIEIDAGTPFELVNAGDGPHSLRIDDPFVGTGDLLPGESTLVVLDTPGRHEGVDAESGSRLQIVILPVPED